jgi:hypothetical protein
MGRARWPRPRWHALPRPRARQGPHLLSQLSLCHPWMDATPTAPSRLRILAARRRRQALVALTLGRGATHKSHGRRHPSRNRPLGVFSVPLSAATNFREKERKSRGGEGIREEEGRGDAPGGQGRTWRPPSGAASPWRHLHCADPETPSSRCTTTITPRRASKRKLPPFQALSLPSSHLHLRRARAGATRGAEYHGVAPSAVLDDGTEQRPPPGAPSTPTTASSGSGCMRELSCVTRKESELPGPSLPFEVEAGTASRTTTPRTLTPLEKPSMSSPHRRSAPRWPRLHRRPYVSSPPLSFLPPPCSPSLRCVPSSRRPGARRRSRF